jgi:para-nitrobenzyl esterase
MVYVHGGAFSSGSGSSPLCEGTRLAQRGDVVVVTLNHRLNVFGYLYLGRIDSSPELADSGNCGQLDLVLALAWVRDNIAAFGGDPGNVTLFGQSGGGAKIATLMAMPAAEGLFHRAITMSGQQVTASGPLNATTRTFALLQALRLPLERAHELRALPAAVLVQAMRTSDPIIGRTPIYFGPVLDERTLRRHPFYPDAAPQSARLPMIIGNTRGETRNLIGRGDPATFDLTWDRLPERMAGELRVDILPERVVAEYRRLYPDYSPADVFFAATTAARSWRGALTELEARAAQPAATYAYQLDWPSPVDGGRWGACHGLDMPLAFGTLAAEGSLTGTGPEAATMSSLLGDAFIAFARSGDPNHTGLPDWRPYRLDRRSTMVFDLPPRLLDDPRGEERRLFEKVPYVQQGT